MLFLSSLKTLVRTLFGYTQRSFTDQEQKASENKFKLLLHFIEVQEMERLCTAEDWALPLKDGMLPRCPTICGSLKIFGDWCSFTMAHHSYIKKLLDEIMRAVNLIFSLTGFRNVHTATKWPLSKSMRLYLQYGGIWIGRQNWKDFLPNVGGTTCSIKDMKRTKRPRKFETFLLSQNSNISMTWTAWFYWFSEVYDLNNISGIPVPPACSWQIEDILGSRIVWANHS